MFKQFNPPIPMRTLDEIYKIPKEYPNLAYVLVNIQENRINGMLCPNTGDLYAVCDREGLHQLFEAISEAEKSGLTTLLDTNPLDNELYVIE